MDGGVAGDPTVWNAPRNVIVSGKRYPSRIGNVEQSVAKSFALYCSCGCTLWSKQYFRSLLPICIATLVHHYTNCESTQILTSSYAVKASIASSTFLYESTPSFTVTMHHQWSPTAIRSTLTKMYGRNGSRLWIKCTSPTANRRNNSRSSRLFCNVVYIIKTLVVSAVRGYKTLSADTSPYKSDIGSHVSN